MNKKVYVFGSLIVAGVFALAFTAYHFLPQTGLYRQAGLSMMKEGRATDAISWLKARYIDPAPPLVPSVDAETGLDRVYIPSRVADNVSLDQLAYVAQLRQSGSPELVRAWLEGDWDVIAGAFFPEFDMGRHVIAPRELPEHWFRFRSLDWGSARPFSVGWWAVSDGELADIPRGALVRYREWYGSTGKPNEGLRMTAEEVARVRQEIAAREGPWTEGELQKVGR
jgi:hypothetical protein